MDWKSCPAATEQEQITTAWVLEWLKLPSAWFGMIVDSASNAVLQALVAARQRHQSENRTAGPTSKLVAYISEHTHSSVEKAAIAAGIGQFNVRHIPADEELRMRPEALANAIAADRSRGLTPFFVTATVGTTSSAAIDPVTEIAGVCRRAGIWLHVDGAYGGAFALLPELRPYLVGVDCADSFVINAHKTMMVPLDCSLLYTAHPQLLREAISIQPEDLKTNLDTVDFMDYGLAPIPRA
jgi:aromatic-L-amino-acid/L-tryptophan decarboxylase